MSAELRLFVPAAALLVACGGLVESEPTVQGPPITEPDAGAPVADAGVGTSSPPPPSGMAPLVSRCLMSDGPFEITNGRVAANSIELSVRVENGEVAVYVTNSLLLRRYVLTNASPCLLERDTTLNAEAQDPFAIDDNGGVWLSSAHVSRIFPGQILKCAMDPSYFDPQSGLLLYDPGPLYFDEGSKTGWAIGPRDDRQIGRFALDGDGCSITVVSSPFSFALKRNTPRDSQGRYHVIESGGISIYDSKNAVVGSYFSGQNPLDATVCAGGVCVMSGTSAGYAITYVDDNGNPRATIPTIKGLVPNRIAAAHTGFVFLAGANDPSREAISQVVVQLAPPPP